VIYIRAARYQITHYRTRNFAIIEVYNTAVQKIHTGQRVKQIPLSVDKNYSVADGVLFLLLHNLHMRHAIMESINMHARIPPARRAYAASFLIL